MGSEMCIRDSYDWFSLRIQELEIYLDEIEAGVPLEDARDNLPGCMRTELIGTFSFEALKNLLAKRLCTRAQQPIRQIAKQMRKSVTDNHPWLGKHLTVQCLPMRICPEQRPGDCPLLKDNGGQVWRKEQAFTILSHRDAETLIAVPESSTSST